MHMGNGPPEHFEGQRLGGGRRGWKRAVARSKFLPSPPPLFFSCCASYPRRHEEKLVAFSQAVSFDFGEISAGECIVKGFSQFRSSDCPEPKRL